MRTPCLETRQLPRPCPTVLARCPVPVDVTNHVTADLGRSLRDIGVLADKRTLVLRIRLPAASINGNLYTQEQVCFSFDGRTCTSTINYRSTVALPDPNACTGHDC